MKTDTAVILVAGIGSRLRPLTDDKPKALVPVCGEPLLSRTLRILATHGVGRIVLATGYQAEAVRSAVGGCGMEVRFCHNDRYGTTQNAVSLSLCAAELRGRDFFKLDGDVVFHRDVLARLEDSDSELAAAVDDARRPDAEAMKVTVDSGGRVLAFGKSIPCSGAFGESIGIERVRSDATPALFDALAAADASGERDLYYEDVYARLISAKQIAARAVGVGDLPWAEIDTFEDLQHAEEQARLMGA